MTRINLLPWREARRAQKKRNFLTMLGIGAVVACAGVVLVHLYIQNLIDNQEARNQYLRDEITKLKKVEKEIQELDTAKERLLSRLEIIQNLQRSRPGMVKVYDTFVRELPEDIYLSSFNTEGKAVTLKGIARSNNVVSHFMRNLEDARLFGVPTLNFIENQAVNTVAASVFQLKVGWAQPKDPKTSEKAP